MITNSLSPSATALHAVHRDLQALAEKVAQVGRASIIDSPSLETPSLADSLIGIKSDTISIRANLKALDYVNTIESTLLDIFA